jgi:hypothetical protein
MTNEDITPNSLPQDGGEGTVRVNPGDASPVSPTGEQAGAMTLEELNQTLGKNFTDKATALKALKDTFSYVGKKAEPDDELLRAKGFMTKQEFETELFLRDNPQHAANKKILESIAKADGISLAEAAKSPDYTKLFESASEYEKVQSLKTVLNPNPRLQQAQERTATVAELKEAGRGSDAQIEAAKVLIEAFDLK